MVLKEKLLLSLGIVALSGTFVIAAFSTSNMANSKIKKSDGLDHYTLTLDSSNSPSALTSSYQDTVSGTYTTADGNSISLNFVKAKASSGKHVDLGSHGMIYNFASESGGISGINAITVTYTGSTMGLRTSLANALSNGASTEGSYSLTSGTRLELPSPRFFSILAADGGNIITSIIIEYTCSLNEDVNRLNGEYSGTGNDNYRYSLFLNNGAVTLQTLDKSTAITATGTATLSGNSLQCSFTSPSAYNGLVYNFTADAQAYKLTFVSKSGTGNANLPQISFYHVYNVEDFESYSSRGNGWDSGSEKASNRYSVTGVRAEYIADYAGTGGTTSPITGSGYQLMGSTDYLNFSTTAGRNNSKCISIKGNGNTMRYFQASAYYGVPRVLGKGNKLSFWCKNAFSNAGMSNASSLCANVTVYAFYTQKVTSSTFNQRTEHEFVVANNNDWTEYTMDLDPNRTYYSIGFMTHNKESTSKYLPIDDVSIYTSSPYEADLTETIAGNYSGYTQYSGGQHLIILSLGSHGQSYIELAGENKSSTGTYTVNGNEISIVTSGVRKIGTFTATFNRTNKTFSNGKFTGTITNQITDNGNINLSPISHSWLCDEDTSALRTQFKRRFQQNGTWQIDNDNDDRIVSISYASISNGKALRRRGYTSGPVSIVLANDFSSSVSAANIIFWVYNPSNSNIDIRTWVYKATGLNSAAEIGAKTATANKWTFVQIGYTRANIYNFQLADFTNSGVALAYDNIAIY